MAFSFSDRHIDDYHTTGATIFRQIVPLSLIADLRRAVEAGREQAYAESGAQAQRFQPICNYRIEQKPFQDFADLPVLRDAVSRVLSPRAVAMSPQSCGVLIEPRGEAWCTQWHRDWRDNTACDRRLWRENMLDHDLFNQMNCALYSDDCTWIVPGSHLRDDTSGEISAFAERPPRPPALTSDGVERELACSAYCRQMPGAHQIVLEAGDYCLYRNTLWHLGCYRPYRKRATLHDFVDTPAFRAWRERAHESMTKKEAVYA